MNNNTNSPSSVLRPSSSVLITGGTGFVGSHLVEELLNRGFSNITVTNYGSNSGHVGTLLTEEQIIRVNLTDRAETFSLIEKLKPDYIFHLASIAVVGDSFDKAAQIFQNNISLQLNLLDAVKQHSPESRVLVVGSGAEYGMITQDSRFQISDDSKKITEQFPLNPINPYAVSKVTQDLLGLSYYLSYGLDIVRARPFNHIGERQTTDFAIPAFASQIVKVERGEQDKITIGNLDAVRDFTDVKDVVKAYITLMEKGVAGEVYNIGSGRGYSMQQILDMMMRLAKVEITVETDPAKIRPIDVPVTVADYSKLNALGWEPEIKIEETLGRVIEEWRGK